MIIGRLIALGLTLILIGGLVGCGSESSESGGEVRTEADDRAEIEAVMDETATRWRYGDKAVLYEQEFEYYQIEYSYDDYLENPRIKRMESDTVRAFDVKEIEFFDRDSAKVTVDVVFVGPTMDTTRMPTVQMMYFHRGRWIRPSVSFPAEQALFEEVRRRADSAAEAEEDEEW